MSNFYSQPASSSVPSPHSRRSASPNFSSESFVLSSSPSGSLGHGSSITPAPVPDVAGYSLQAELSATTPFGDILPSHSSFSSQTSQSRSSSSGPHLANAIDYSATTNESQAWTGHSQDGSTGASDVMSGSVSSSDVGEGSSRAPAEDPASLPVSVSIPRSTAPSHARKKAADHVPRPRNAFILFRSHAHRQGLVPKELSANHSNISVIISHMWRSLPTEEREMWAREAQREKDEHALLYPDYKFKPVYRRENVVRRVVRKEGDEEERCLKIADHILRTHGRDGVQPTEEPNSNIISSSASERKRVRRAESRAKSRNKIAAAAASASSSLEQGHRRRALRVARKAVREVSKSPATTCSAASPAEGHTAMQQPWNSNTQAYVAPILRMVRRASSVPALADAVNWAKGPQVPTSTPAVSSGAHPVSAIPHYLKSGFDSYPTAPHHRSATYREPMHLNAPLHTPMSAFSTVSASSTGLSSGLAGVHVAASPHMPVSPMTQVMPISAAPLSPTSFFGSTRAEPPRPYTSAGIASTFGAGASASAASTSALDLSSPTWSNFRDVLISSNVGTSYGNARRPSGTGWQSGARLANADIGLPVMRPRGSTGHDSSSHSLSVAPQSTWRHRAAPERNGWGEDRAAVSMEEVDELDSSDFAAAAKAAQETLFYQQDAELQHLVQGETSRLDLASQQSMATSTDGGVDFLDEHSLFKAPMLSHSQAHSNAGRLSSADAVDWAVYGSNAHGQGAGPLTQVSGADAAFVQMLMAPRASASLSLALESTASRSHSQQSVGSASREVRRSPELSMASTQSTHDSALGAGDLGLGRPAHEDAPFHDHPLDHPHFATPLELALGNAPWPSFEHQHHHIYPPTHTHQHNNHQEHQDALR